MRWNNYKEHIYSQIYSDLIFINFKKMDALSLKQEWDKTFPQSDKVEHNKVSFHNRYGITLAADVYMPKKHKGKFSAIAFSCPYCCV